MLDERLTYLEVKNISDLLDPSDNLDLYLLLMGHLSLISQQMLDERLPYLEVKNISDLLDPSDDLDLYLLLMGHLSRN